jgi:hypothetical protein
MKTIRVSLIGRDLDELPVELAAVESRHRQVRQDHVEAATCADRLNCVEAIGRDLDLVIGEQRVHDHGPEIGVVIDHEYACHAGGTSRDPKRSARGRWSRLLAADNDLFPLVLVAAGRGLELRVAGVNERWRGAVVLGGGGSLEVSDAFPERVSDAGQLLGAEDDHDDQQDHDELTHSRHTDSLKERVSWSQRSAARTVPHGS